MHPSTEALSVVRREEKKKERKKERTKNTITSKEMKERKGEGINESKEFCFVKLFLERKERGQYRK